MTQNIDVCASGPTIRSQLGGIREPIPAPTIRDLSNLIKARDETRAFIHCALMQVTCALRYPQNSDDESQSGSTYSTQSCGSSDSIIDLSTPPGISIVPGKLVMVYLTIEEMDFPY